MHLFSENLAVEVANYYRNIVLGHGVTPKVFTMVNGEGDQYLFFIDDLQMEDIDPWLKNHPDGYVIIRYNPEKEDLEKYQIIVTIPHKEKMLSIVQKR